MPGLHPLTPGAFQPTSLSTLQVVTSNDLNGSDEGSFISLEHW